MTIANIQKRYIFFPNLAVEAEVKVNVSNICISDDRDNCNSFKFR